MSAGGGCYKTFNVLNMDMPVASMGDFRQIHALLFKSVETPILSPEASRDAASAYGSVEAAFMDDSTEHQLDFSVEVVEAFTEACVELICVHGSFHISYVSMEACVKVICFHGRSHATFHGTFRGSNSLSRNLSLKLSRKLSWKQFDFTEACM